ncbi:hypothetical protein [Rhodohalobacter mucosus]|uniref:hypothetical protein n=1 Tax=Rhodohalobacter mucosus TaxID=2079485 RepID=UPI0011B1EC69|nr:hypothetical protein [Rhodohalobacter mucosus]
MGFYISFIEKKNVQTHYLIRPQECTDKEIDTIIKIQEKIWVNHPEAKKILRPVKFMNINHVRADSEITNEYERIKSKQFISVQYEMLARYSKHEGLGSVEVGHLNQATEIFNTSPVFLKYLDLPVLGLEKLDMAKISEEHGWIGYMKMTNFCRRLRKGKPCGICGPCTDAVIAGLGWRLPLSRRIIANIQLPFRKWWRNNYDKQSSGLFKKFREFIYRKDMV